MRRLAIGAAAGTGLLVTLVWRRRADEVEDRERAVEGDEQPVDRFPDAATPSADGACSTPRGPLGKRLTRSTRDKHGTVRQSPTELLAQARTVDPTITLDELTAARLAASEHASGTFCELEAIIDAELNRAERKRMSLTEHLTSRKTYGKQGGRAPGGRKRKASTARDPYQRHLRAARAVLSGQRRGAARGAVQFFDPVAQLRAHRRWRAGESDRRHCPPLVILERWSFARKYTPSKGKSRSEQCTLDPKRSGRHRLEWVGPIPGIDPLRLLLMRPATAQHEAQYRAAHNLLRARLPMP